MNEHTSDDHFPTAQAHAQGLASLHKYDHFLVSGDESGEIKVWDLDANFASVTTGRVSNIMDPQTHKVITPQVTSCVVIQGGLLGSSAVAVGDSCGQLTLLKMDSDEQQ